MGLVHQCWGSYPKACHRGFWTGCQDFNMGANTKDGRRSVLYHERPDNPCKLSLFCLVEAVFHAPGNAAPQIFLAMGRLFGPTACGFSTVSFQLPKARDIALPRAAATRALTVLEANINGVSMKQVVTAAGNPPQPHSTSSSVRGACQLQGQSGQSLRSP